MKYLFILIISSLSISGFSQKVENVNINQNGGELIFQYDLNSPSDKNFKISLLYSVDKENWKSVEKVYGDIGDSISMGKSKKMVLWLDHIVEYKEKTFFKIIAEYNDVDLKKNGTLSDKYDNSYNWIRIGQTKWITKNLKASKTDNDCGGFFSNQNALKACPDGWRLPTDEEWMELEIEFGVNKEKAKEHGLRDIQLDKLANVGFNLNECNYKTTLYPNQKALAFWTSSENKMLYTGYSDKYFARIIRLNENKISKELRLKTEELSVRCVQSASYIAKAETIFEKTINLKPNSGITNHPFTGEELKWQYIGDAIWLKNDITGSYTYKELTDRCPAGWRLPEKEEWEKLFMEISPSIKSINQKDILNERASSSGIWGLNLSNNDYWMNTIYYTYNTFWINKNDKEDSKKLVAFPSNKNGKTEWLEKQSNEKAKVRCVLDNKDFMEKKELVKTGTFVDKRDQKEYAFVEIENKVWMADNLNFSMGENSSCRNNIKADCELFGHMYNIEVVTKGCPDGYRIPTSEEWKYLLINKAANNHKILYPFGGTGFDLLLGGEVVSDEDKKTEIYTAEYLFVDEGKPGYYYIDSKGKAELNTKAKKKDFYYVRCIKEKDYRF